VPGVVPSAGCTASGISCSQVRAGRSVSEPGVPALAQGGPCTTETQTGHPAGAARPGDDVAASVARVFIPSPRRLHMRCPGGRSAGQDNSGILRGRPAVTGGEFIVLAPWLAFCVGLAVVCFRLHSRGRLPPARRPLSPPGPRPGGPAARASRDQAAGLRAADHSAPPAPGVRGRPGRDDGPGPAGPGQVA
jgi:hypothetical protein